MRGRVDRIGAALQSLWSEPAARLLAAVIVLSAAVTLVVVIVLGGSESPKPAPELFQEPITVTQRLSTATALFGDRVTAEIDVFTRDTRVDPRSVQVTTDFRPYQATDTEIERSTHGSVSLLRTRIELQCLTSACVPRRDGGRLFRFAPMTVSYRQGAQPLRHVEPWDPLQVYSRLASERPQLADLPPDLGTGFRVSPTLTRLCFVLLAAVLGVVGAWLLVTGLWPRVFYSSRAWRRLSPLEQALAQLDAAARIDDVATRRRVLEQLATRLGEAELPTLEERSRSLAWAASAPDAEELDLLGEQVRSSLNGGRR